MIRDVSQINEKKLKDQTFFYRHLKIVSKCSALQTLISQYVKMTNTLVECRTDLERAGGPCSSVCRPRPPRT